MQNNSFDQALALTLEEIDLGLSVEVEQQNAS